MAQREPGDCQLYFSRLRPICPYLFNLAHAVTGNAEQAQYALQCALLDCWAAGEVSAGRHGFREELRSATLRAALRIADSEEAECDWDGLNGEGEGRDPVAARLEREPAPLRRLAALRYGCGLSPRRIARLTGDRTASVRESLARLETRLRREAGNSRRIERSVRACLQQASPQMPPPGTFFRDFRADAERISPSRRLPARILRAALAVLLTLACIAVFWLMAVLLQPSVPEPPASERAEAHAAQSTPFRHPSAFPGREGAPEGGG